MEAGPAKSRKRDVPAASARVSVPSPETPREPRPRWIGCGLCCETVTLSRGYKLYTFEITHAQHNDQSVHYYTFALTHVTRPARCPVLMPVLTDTLRAYRAQVAVRVSKLSGTRLSDLEELRRCECIRRGTLPFLLLPIPTASSILWTSTARRVRRARAQLLRPWDTPGLLA